MHNYYTSVPEIVSNINEPEDMTDYRCDSQNENHNYSVLFVDVVL